MTTTLAPKIADDKPLVEGSPAWLRDLSKHFIAETRSGILKAAATIEAHTEALGEARNLINALDAGDWADCPEKDEEITDVVQQINCALNGTTVPLRLKPGAYAKVIKCDEDPSFVNRIGRIHGDGDSEGTWLLVFKDSVAMNEFAAAELEVQQTGLI